MTRIQLLALASFALLAACSGSNTSSTNQLISCETDPETGVVLSCEPTDSSDSDSPNSCVDVDEDGDGEPSDESSETPNPITRSGSGSSDEDESEDDADDDSDDDGIPDSDDCDEQEGEDDCDNEVDLPYAIEPGLGSTTTPIADAFAEKGAQPAAILSVTMDGGDWRLAELVAGTSFVVTQADCDHVGNRDIGRDRVVVTWQNADGSTDSDHLDIRYCN